ncbi:FAD synthetase chloroplastic [Raphidocelis subcapitata]|uniref:FAD synthase n=1 Tax=Raphidocelis subcapitata TaxID=307507 RepID=A0A2V0PCU4_9CHLO|nr:FAD synthetase chloroplastic [Raphidocelis subcapitata]|eukprot:GBF97671.1 FAD synthetase chloroplastic [Raphidocelis subcapitata]
MDSSGGGTPSPEGLVQRCAALDWRRPLPGHDGHPAARPVVALGKFDALHRGHMALAAAAASLGGSPLLLSFSGMAEVLGWPQRLPLVPPCDRSRVLNLWARELGLSPCSGKEQQPGPSAAADRAVRQRYIPFAAIRSLSPEAFVALLARDLGAAGVVAGVNYRFGYKAAGDVEALQRLAAEAGMPCRAVELVAACGAGSDGGGADAPVSSSRIRELLAAGSVGEVAALLGRPYRLVAAVKLGPGMGPQRRAEPGGSEASGSCDSGVGSGSFDGVGESSSSCGAPAGGVTSSMDGSESEAVPLLLRDGGAAALVAPEGLLNAAPGAGRYSAALMVHAGAGPADELLLLEAACDSQAAGEGDGSGCSAATCWPRPGVEVVLGRDGLLLPSAPLLRALAAAGEGASGGRALVVLDLERRLGGA